MFTAEDPQRAAIAEKALSDTTPPKDYFKKGEIAREIGNQAWAHLVATVTDPNASEHLKPLFCYVDEIFCRMNDRNSTQDMRLE